MNEVKNEINFIKNNQGRYLYISFVIIFDLIEFTLWNFI
ncbi:hypothetical protein BH20BAC1_BH20BAC1_24270 [soil metagenome]